MPNNAKMSVQEAMNVYSNFAYYDGMQYKLDKSSHFKKYEEVEQEFLLGIEIAKSDLYLAEIVGKLSFATVDLILYELRLLHSNKAYENVILTPAQLPNIRQGMKRLCNNGLARDLTYKSPKGINMHVFCLSDTGMQLIKKVLYSKLKNEDTMLAIEPVEEAFRRLTSNYCAQILKQRYGISISYGKKVYTRSWGKNYIYGKHEYVKNEQRTVILVEPIYFNTNKKHIPSGRLVEHNIEHLQFLDSYIEKLRSEDSGVRIKIIFVVEDKVGTMKAVKIALENLRFLKDSVPNDIKYAIENNQGYTLTTDQPTELKNICVTTEPLLYNTEKGEEFLGISKVIDGKASFKANYNILD